MSLQDIIFSVGSIIFILALIPSIRSAAKPALASSLMTGSILAIYAVTYLTFNHPLYYAAITTLGTALCWFILAWQKHQLDKQPQPWGTPTPYGDAVAKDYIDLQHESAL